MSRFTSPAIDIAYFFLTSTDKSFREAHFQELLQTYYLNLANIIRATGSDPNELFPEAELQRQLRQFGVYAVMLAPMMVQIMIADSSEIGNLDDMADTMAMGNDETGPLTHLSPAKRIEYVNRLKDTIADARRYGWL